MHADGSRPPSPLRSHAWARASRTGHLVAGALLLVVIGVACTGAGPQSSTPPPADGRPAASPSVELATAAAAPPAPVEGASWVAVAHPRRDVLELTLEQVRAVLAGRTRDWAELGGAVGPIEAFVPADDVKLLADFAGSPIAVRARPAGELLAAVTASRDAFALVRPEAVTAEVLALVVEGHDPLGDPAATSPLRIAGTIRPFDPVLIVSPGEILPVRCADAALEAHGDFGAMFEATRALLERADIAIAGLDTPLTDVSPPTPCEATFTLQGRARAAEAIAAAGIDLLFVNGNHMLDCWRPCPPYAALRDTLARLRRLGVATVGAGEDAREARRPHVLEAGVASGRGTRFAFLAYDEIAPWNWAAESAPGTAPLRRDVVIEDVRAAKALADVVVVGMSWGIEYTPDPTSSQRALAAAAIEAGATLVVGNHPHVVQAIERREDGGRDALVIYAQGNYIFDQSWSVPTTQAVMLQAGFLDGRLIGYRLRPVVTRGDPELRRGLYRPELVAPSGPEGREILGRIWAAEDRLSP